MKHARLLIFSTFILIALVGNTLTANPWGKDADLCHFSKKNPTTDQNKTLCSTPIIGSLGEILIGFHQNVISPADGPRSHFLPSSSQYTLDAMRKYGFLQGYLLGCDRLMRENSDPWVYRTKLDGQENVMKWDPVR